MSHLIARLLLSMLVFPLGGLVYTVAVVISFNHFGGFWREEAWVVAGAVTWAFVAGYWVLLWHKTVRWDTRVGTTVGAAVAAAVAGTAIGAICNTIERGFGSFVGSSSAILLWLVATCFLWRESPAERAERLGASGHDGVVCPTCGYNLTGLKEPRCPECGSEFTLDQLLAAQPSRATAELL
ncbi:MAG TPA: hypothetical protein VGR35_01705 [Tepidisphaeraceae bacterium]|nr:hypothetical protein [Tepidisphaeraceae bacterium]